MLINVEGGTLPYPLSHMGGAGQTEPSVCPPRYNPLDGGKYRLYNGGPWSKAGPVKATVLHSLNQAYFPDFNSASQISRIAWRSFLRTLAEIHPSQEYWPRQNHKLSMWESLKKLTEANPSI